jgi:hypothetical protein
MISNLKEDSNKQTNDVRESTEGLDEKVSDMDEKFSKNIGILKKTKNKQKSWKLKLQEIK